MYRNLKRKMSKGYRKIPNPLSQAAQQKEILQMRYRSSQEIPPQNENYLNLSMTSIIAKS